MMCACVYLLIKNTNPPAPPSLPLSETTTASRSSPPPAATGIIHYDMKSPRWGVLSQSMMDSGGNAECWSRWGMDEAPACQGPAGIPRQSLQSGDGKSSAPRNPSYAADERSVDREEPPPPRPPDPWMDLGFKGWWRHFSSSNELMVHVCWCWMAFLCCGNYYWKFKKKHITADGFTYIVIICDIFFHNLSNQT